ncbi:MAG: hypothetical protein F9K18_05820 [Thermoanaerobaculia bacterium]|nr:MAG: hypothetical protein F9K18_05820 [Thermoanaerobaculia bacterium]
MLRRALVVLLLLAAPAAASDAPAAGPEPPAPCPAKTFRFEAPAGWQVEAVPGLPAGREACSLVLMLDEENVAGLMRIDAHAEPLAYAAGDDPARTIFERYRAALVAEGALEVDLEPSWRNDTLKVAAGSPFDRASMRAYPARRREPAIPLELAFVTLHTPGSYYTVALITPAQSDQPEVWDVNQAALRQVLNSFDITTAK